MIDFLEKFIPEGWWFGVFLIVVAVIVNGFGVYLALTGGAY